MTYINGFIKDDKLYMLEEYHRTTDLLDLSNDVVKFKEKIKTIQESCIVGVIGRLGSGKTTFINQFIESSGVPVFQFEAWKYPGRKDLRENFILEVANQMGSDIFNQYLKKIKGTQNEDTKSLVDILCSLPGKWKDYIPGLDSVQKGVEYFLQTSPATRTFQLQELLTELLSSINDETIYIAIEDADRAGDEGLFFLETLNYYIKEMLEHKKIIVLTLIGEENYEDEQKKFSFQKCIDLEHSYRIENPSLQNFVEELFIDEINKDKTKKGQIVSFLEGLFIEYRITMRLLKSCIRQANLHYKILAKTQQSGVDIRICLMLEFAKKIKPDSESDSYFRLRKKSRNISDLSTIFGALINCVIADNHRINGSRINGSKHDSIYELDHHNKKTKLIDRNYISRDIKIIENDYISAQGDAKSDPIRYYKDQFDKKKQYFGLSYVYFEQ